MDEAPERPRVAPATRIIRYRTRDAATIAAAQRWFHLAFATFGFCLALFGIANIVLLGRSRDFESWGGLIVGLALTWQGLAPFVNSFSEFADFAGRQRGFLAFLLHRITTSTNAGNFCMTSLAVGVSSIGAACFAAFIEHRAFLSFGVSDRLLLGVWFLGQAIVSRRRTLADSKRAAVT